MRLQVVSDLHFDTYRHVEPTELVWRLIERTDADVLVLAGDVLSLDNADAFLAPLCAHYPHVVYVPGNHEYWGQAPIAGESQLLRLAAAYDNLHVLSHVTGYITTIDGQRFVGDTAWVPETPDSALQNTNDPRAIPGFKDWAWTNHRRFRSFLERELRPDDILVTHYLPVWSAISPKFRGSPLNCWFVSDFGGLLAEVQPQLAIFGHTHDPQDFVLGWTRFLCNPAGYPNERLGKYQPDLTITL